MPFGLVDTCLHGGTFMFVHNSKFLCPDAKGTRPSARVSYVGCLFFFSGLYFAVSAF